MQLILFLKKNVFKPIVWCHILKNIFYLFVLTLFSVLVLSSLVKLVKSLRVSPRSSAVAKNWLMKTRQ